MLNRKTRETILVFIVLAAPVALWWFIDEDLLQKLALATLALGIAGVFGLRKYLDRIDLATSAIPDLAQGGQIDPAALPLKPFERMALGISDITYPEHLLRALRDRRKLLESVGMTLAVCALIALIVLIVIHGD